MEKQSGNIFIRPNIMRSAGERVDRHTHNFDHTTFTRIGWLLIRGRLPSSHPDHAKLGGEIVRQFASPDFAYIRELLLKYEPEKVLRPVRFPDLWTKPEPEHEEYAINGRMPIFDVRFIRQGEDVPEGGEEIIFKPVGYHALIKADVCHEIMSLASETIFDCTYSHRDPQGKVVQINNGWGSSAYV